MSNLERDLGKDIQASRSTPIREGADHGTPDGDKGITPSAIAPQGTGAEFSVSSHPDAQLGQSAVEDIAVGSSAEDESGTSSTASSDSSHEGTTDGSAPTGQTDSSGDWAGAEGMGSGSESGTTGSESGSADSDTSHADGSASGAESDSSQSDGDSSRADGSSDTSYESGSRTDGGDSTTENSSSTHSSDGGSSDTTNSDTSSRTDNSEGSHEGTSSDDRSNESGSTDTNTNATSESDSSGEAPVSSDSNADSTGTQDSGDSGQPFSGETSGSTEGTQSDGDTSDSDRTPISNTDSSGTETGTTDQQTGDTTDTDSTTDNNPTGNTDGSESDSSVELDIDKSGGGVQVGDPEPRNPKVDEPVVEPTLPTDESDEPTTDIPPATGKPVTDPVPPAGPTVTDTDDNEPPTTITDLGEKDPTATSDGDKDGVLVGTDGTESITIVDIDPDVTVKPGSVEDPQDGVITGDPIMDTTSPKTDTTDGDGTVEPQGITDPGVTDGTDGDKIDPTADPVQPSVITTDGDGTLEPQGTVDTSDPAADPKDPSGPDDSGEGKDTPNEEENASGPEAGAPEMTEEEKEFDELVTQVSKEMLGTLNGKEPTEAEIETMKEGVARDIDIAHQHWMSEYSRLTQHYAHVYTIEEAQRMARADVMAMASYVSGIAVNDISQVSVAMFLGEVNAPKAMRVRAQNYSERNPFAVQLGDIDGGMFGLGRYREESDRMEGSHPDIARGASRIKQAEQREAGINKAVEHRLRTDGISDFSESRYTPDIDGVGDNDDMPVMPKESIQQEQSSGYVEAHGAVDIVEPAEVVMPNNEQTDSNREVATTEAKTVVVDGIVYEIPAPEPMPALDDHEAVPLKVLDQLVDWTGKTDVGADINQGSPKKTL